MPLKKNSKDFDLVYPWASVSSTRTSREYPPIVKGRSRTLKRMEWTTRCRGWPWKVFVGSDTGGISGGLWVVEEVACGWESGPGMAGAV